MRFAPFMLVYFWSSAINGVPLLIFKETLRRVVGPFGIMLFASAVDWDYAKLRRLLIYITISGLLMGGVAGYQVLTKQAPQSSGWIRSLIPIAPLLGCGPFSPFPLTTAYLWTFPFWWHWGFCSPRVVGLNVLFGG